MDESIKNRTVALLSNGLSPEKQQAITILPQLQEQLNALASQIAEYQNIVANDEVCQLIIELKNQPVS